MISNNSKNFFFTKTHIAIVLIGAILYFALTGVFYWQTRENVLYIAEQNIKEYLRNISALRKNVSESQKMEMSRLQDSGVIDRDYFMPQLLSSSFNAREVNSYYNELRRSDGLPPIEIRFPSANARNPINDATEKEIGILEKFSKNELRNYKEIIDTKDGKALYYAIPTIRNNKECLKCHSNPNIAPKEMLELYGGERGFYEKEGDLRAILSAIYPMNKEIEIANATFIKASLVTLFVFTIIYLLTISVLLNQRKYQRELENLNKSLEKRVHQRTKELEESTTQILNQKSLLEKLLQNAPIPIFYKNRDGIYMGCNIAFEEAFGFEHGEIIGKTVFDVAPTELANRYFLEDENLYTNPNQPQIYDFTVIDRKTDENRDVIFYKSVFFDKNGECAGLIGAILDITERKKLENELQELNKELENRVASEVERCMLLEKEKQANEAQLIQQSRLAVMGEMIGAITHQWQQPLTAINLVGQNIIMLEEHEGATKEDVLKSIDQILKQNEFMIQTIKDFRNFFKPSKQKLYFKPCEACEDVKKLYAIHLKKYNIKLHINPHAHFESIGFPNEFKQVILNILSNAVDVFAERNIKDGEIAIDFEVTHDFGKIYIRDNGGGIPADLLPDKIFERYFTTKGDKGSGIGLQLAKTIIEDNMDGKITALNVNNGAMFTISLPITNSSTDNLKWKCLHTNS